MDKLIELASELNLILEVKKDVEEQLELAEKDLSNLYRIYQEYIQKEDKIVKEIKEKVAKGLDIEEKE